MSCARRDLCGGRPEPYWPSGLTGKGPFLPRPPLSPLLGAEEGEHLLEGVRGGFGVVAEP